MSIGYPSSVKSSPSSVTKAPDLDLYWQPCRSVKRVTSSLHCRSRQAGEGAWDHPGEDACGGGAGFLGYPTAAPLGSERATGLGPRGCLLPFCLGTPTVLLLTRRRNLWRPAADP